MSGKRRKNPVEALGELKLVAQTRLTPRP